MRLRKMIGWIASMALVFSAGGICALSNENQSIHASADTTADDAFTTDGTGDGSADKPYLIDTAQELYYISTKTSSFKEKYIKMTADIDLSEYGASFNDGKGWPGISNFSGYFDGNGYAVSKLYINETSSGNRGLFNNLTGGGVQNLTVKEATVVSVKNNTGAIVGTLNHANAVLTNCIVESGTVKGAQSVGGVVGALTKGTVSYCYNAASVTFAEGVSSSQCVGGVVGTCNGTVSNCVNYGTVSVFFMTSPVLITNFTGNINNFNAIFFLSQGKPLTLDYFTGAGQTDLLVTWLYNLTMNSSDFSYASAIGIIIFVFSAFFSLIFFRKSKMFLDTGDFKQ